MTPQQVLRYQLAILLASSGRPRVLAALADLLELRDDELDAQLAAIGKPVPKKSLKNKRGDPQQTLNTIQSMHPDKAEALRVLAARYMNRTFLTELREVRRFLEGHDYPPRAIKSRTDALPQLLKVLANLDSNELRSLCELADSSDFSSLGIISDHIMGHERR